MVRWQISIPPLLLCRCHRQGDRDFIQPDQARGGEQTALQTTHITSKHAPQQWGTPGLLHSLARFSVYVCVCVMLSAFSMKHCSKQTEQCRGSLGQRRTLVHLAFAMCPTDTCAHIQRAHWLCGAVHRKPFIRHTWRENILAQEENNGGRGNWFWFESDGK